MAEERANIDLLKSGSDGPGSLAPRSRRLLAIVAVLGIGIVLLGAGDFWLRRGRRPPPAPAGAPRVPRGRSPGGRRREGPAGSGRAHFAAPARPDRSAGSAACRRAVIAS